MMKKMLDIFIMIWFRFLEKNRFFFSLPPLEGLLNMGNVMQPMRC